MFPPVEEAVFQNNPKFAALHKTLTTRVLNPDGSSKNSYAAEREAAAETLREHRVRATRKEVLRNALDTVPLDTQTPPLPAELIELIVLLSAHLSRTTPKLPPSDLNVLQDSPLYRKLPHYVPQIAALLSHHIHSQALALARILNPSTNASFLHRKILCIPEDVALLLLRNKQSRSALESARLALIPLTTRLLNTHLSASTLLIQHLEHHKHNTVARHATQTSTFLFLSAQSLLLSTHLSLAQSKRDVYTPSTQTALRNYREHLRLSTQRLKERRRDAEAELQRYGVGVQGKEVKERTMREIARVWGAMGTECGEVERDLVKLQGA